MSIVQTPPLSLSTYLKKERYKFFSFEIQSCSKKKKKRKKKKEKKKKKKSNLKPSDFISTIKIRRLLEGNINL